VGSSDVCAGRWGGRMSEDDEPLVELDYRIERYDRKGPGYGIAIIYCLNLWNERAQL
jgi:hypothetical protein